MKKNTPEKKSLFDIEYEYNKTLQELENYFLNSDEDELGVVPDEFVERLNINRDELEHKLYNYYMAIKGIANKEDMFKLEETRLKQKRGKLERTVAYLKERIGDAVKLFGSETTTKSGNPQIKTDMLNVTYITSKKLDIIDGSKIPSRFKYKIMRVVTTEEEAVNIAKYFDEKKNSAAIAKIEDYIDVKAMELHYQNLKDEDLPDWLQRVESGYVKFS